MKKVFIVYFILSLSCLYSQLEKQTILESDNYNPIDINTYAFACHSRRNYVAASSCGDIGIVYRQVETLEKQKKFTIYYANIAALQEKSIVWQGSYSYESDMRCYLIYDANCKPHIFVQKGQKYFHFYEEQGNWRQRALYFDFKSFATKDMPLREHKISQIVLGQNKNIFILFHVTLLTANKDRHRFFLAENANNQWSYSYPEQIPKDSQKIFHLQVINSNQYSCVYNSGSDLLEGEVQKNTWKENTIDKGGSVEEAGWEASCAYDKDGNMVVASTFMRVAGSGSFIFSELRLHTKKNGIWQKETLCQKSSGYHGSDGTKYTGASPAISIDDNNQPHILFNDIASWHNNKGDNDFSEGNLRYMFHNGSKWQDTVIYAQPGKSDSPKTIHEILYPQLIINKKHIYFLAVERITHSESTRYAYKPSMQFSIVVSVK